MPDKSDKPIESSRAHHIDWRFLMKILKDWLKYLIPFTLGVIIFSFVTQYDKTIALFESLLSGGVYLVSRFFVGFGLAYFLNFPMRFLEKKFKLKRIFSILITYLLMVIIIFLVIWGVMPSLVDSVRQILNTSQTYYIQVQDLLNSFFGALSPSAQGVVNQTLRQASDGIMEYLKQLVSMDYLGSFLSRTLSSSVRTLANIVFGLFISFYALWDKEKLVHMMKRLIYATWPQKKAEKTLSLSRDADYNFSRFLIGKVWDSLIIGVLSLIVYMIFGVPVPVFLAFVAGITNMVPYFGPFAGGLITAVVLLGFSPIDMITGVLIVIAVQTLDGAVIGPKILGDACGISPLLIIISITVGGDLFGLPGILFAVPVVGTFKQVIIDKLLNKRLKEQGLDVDEPDKYEEPEEKVT